MMEIHYRLAGSPRKESKKEEVEEDDEEERKKVFSCTHSKGPAWHLQHFFFFQSSLPLPLSSSAFPLKHATCLSVGPAAQCR